MQCRANLTGAASAQSLCVAWCSHAGSWLLQLLGWAGGNVAKKWGLLQRNPCCKETVAVLCASSSFGRVRWPCQTQLCQARVQVCRTGVSGWNKEQESDGMHAAVDVLCATTVESDSSLAGWW